MAMIPHRGDLNLTLFAVDDDTVIDAGDMLQFQTDDVRPAGYDANADGTGDIWNTSLAQTQLDFKEVFAGVAVQRSRDGDTAEIQVATEGCFLFDIASTTFEAGAYVAPAKASGNNLEDQKVVVVTDPELAIGRIKRRSTTSTTKAWVEIKSTRMHGGVQPDVGS